jgi:hypothetical protein
VPLRADSADEPAEREPEPDRHEPPQPVAAFRLQHEQQRRGERQVGRLQAHDDEARRPRQPGPRAEPADRERARAASRAARDELVRSRQHRPHREGRGQDHVVVQLALRPQPEARGDDRDESGAVRGAEPPQERVRERAEQHLVHEEPPAVPLLARQHREQQVDRLPRLRHLRHERRAAPDVARPARQLARAEAVLHDAVPAQRLQVLVGHADVAAEHVVRVERAARERFRHRHVEHLGRVRHERPARHEGVAQEQHRTEQRQRRRLQQLARRRRRAGSEHANTMQQTPSRGNGSVARPSRERACERI